MSAAPAMRAALRRRGPVVILAAALCFQLASFQRVLGFERLWTPDPIVTDDYSYHYANALTAAEFLRRGRWWGYDPFLYAGYPAAALLSIDNRALEVVTAATLALGASRAGPPRAQKLYLLAYWLLVPLLGWATSRAFGFGAWSAAVHAVLAVLFSECSLTRPMVRLFGMVSFSWATLLAPWVAGLFFALLRRWTRPRLWGLAASAQLVCLVHGLGPFLAVAPILAAAAPHRRSFDRRRLSELGVAVAVLLLLNLGWAVPMLHFQHHLVEGSMSSQMLQAGGLGDALGVLLLGRNPFILFHYPAFRPALVALAVLGVALGWRSQHRSAVWVCATGALALLALTYSGAFFTFVSESQPLRFLPAALAWLLPLATLGLVDGWRRLARWPAAPPAALALLVGLACWAMGAPLLARTLGGQAAPLRTGLPPELHDVVSLVDRHTGPTARVLVEDSGGLSKHQYGGSHAAALLPHLIPREYLLGPAPYVPLVHESIRLTEGALGQRWIDEIPPQELRRHFDRYNVGWIVAWSKRCKGAFDAHRFTRRVAERGKFVLYEIDRAHSFFLRGSGRVEAGYDRIVLSELEEGGSVILSYHYLDTLRSDSGHPIRRHGEPGDPLGLIEIEDVPERLVIRNRGLVGGVFADAFRGASG
jgi:hypothetical protein